MMYTNSIEVALPRDEVLKVMKKISGWAAILCVSTPESLRSRID